MARRSYLWYSVIVRILTAIAALMAIVVMGISAWSLAEFLNDEKQMKALSRQVNTESLDADTSESENATAKPLAPESEGHKIYKTIILVCLSVAIFAGFLQLVASLNALCSCSKNVSGRVKTWLVMNVITFLLLLLCFLIPFSFNKENSTTLGFSDFGAKLTSHMETVLGEIRTKEFHEIWTTNLYTYVLLANNLFILFFMILLGCCLRCGEYAYESVY